MHSPNKPMPPATLAMAALQAAQASAVRLHAADSAEQRATQAQIAAALAEGMWTMERQHPWLAVAAYALTFAVGFGWSAFKFWWLQ